MPNDTLSRLEGLIKTLEMSVTKDEFVSSLENVLSFVTRIEGKHSAMLDTMEQTWGSILQRAQDEHSSNLADLKKQVDQAFVGDAVAKMQTEHGQRMQTVDSRMATVRDGRDGAPGPKGDKGERGPAGSPDSPEDVVAKVNRATTKISADRIEGVGERIGKIETHLGRVQTPAKAYRIYNKDCSSQCDGANKTFSVGGTHFGIVGVFSTEAPGIYRPIIDYTETKTGFLLTDQVNAPASGQTLVAQFLK